MPESFVIDISLPPQMKAGETNKLEETLDSIETEAQSATVIGIGFSIAFNMNMQAIWGGINAVQIIAHLPLNNINFPINAQKFYYFLTQIISFDFFSPFDHFDFGFTETRPYHSSYDMLGYQTSNFFENLGSIAVIGVLLFLKHLIQQPSYIMLTRIGCCRSKSSKLLLTLPDVSDTWTRFFIETYLEFVISCLVGIKLLHVITGKATSQDKISHKCAVIFLVFICLFTISIVYFSLFKGKELKALKKDQI